MSKFWGPLHLTGWPIGIVLDGNDESRPRPTSEGILAIVAAQFPSSPFPRQSFDYWTLSTSGDFYTLRSLSEDKLDEDRARKVIYSDVRIVRATELLLHCANLCKALGTEPNAQVELRLRYGGLRGRQLTSSSIRWIDYHGKNVHDNEVNVGPIRFRLGAVDTELFSLVKKLCAPLFMIFDYTEISDEVYEQIITEFVKGRHG